MSLPPGSGGNHNLSTQRSTKPENPKATLVHKWMEPLNLCQGLQVPGIKTQAFNNRPIATFYNDYKKKERSNLIQYNII